MFKVKNMHSGSPLDPGVHEARQSRVTYITWLGKAKFCILKLTSSFHNLSSAPWLMLIEEGYDNSKIAFFMLFWECMDRFWAN